MNNQFGVWQVKEQIWTSWKEHAVWKTKEIAEANMAELRKAYPGVQFEVREWR